MIPVVAWDIERTLITTSYENDFAAFLALFLGNVITFKITNLCRLNRPYKTSPIHMCDKEGDEAVSYVGVSAIIVGNKENFMAQIFKC
ncbi:MAG: hypothetical protein QXO84_00950 [Candidatus Aenigmatarchaeota archaeon]